MLGVMAVDLEILGHLIRTAREERAWSLADASAASGVNYSTISRWERGEHQPGAARLKRLAKALRGPDAVNEWMQLAGHLDAAGEWLAPDPDGLEPTPDRLRRIAQELREMGFSEGQIRVALSVIESYLPPSQWTGLGLPHPSGRVPSSHLVPEPGADRAPKSEQSEE
jgi:transcriptional regulator with XRE-family HTH domain